MHNFDPYEELQKLQNNDIQLGAAYNEHNSLINELIGQHRTQGNLIQTLRLEVIELNNKIRNLEAQVAQSCQ